MLRDKLQTLTEWKKYGAVFLLGALSVIAMPPIGFFPVLLLTVPAFIWLSETAENKRQSFLLGWAFGAAYFIVGFYWVSVALFVDIAQWIWVLPFSLIAGPGLFGLYYGFIPLLTRRLRNTPDLHALAFVALWALMDYVRGHLFTGFPWNLMGYTWDYFAPIMQTSSLVGIYGLTLLTVIWTATPAIKNKNIQSAIFLSFVFCLSFGLLRLHLSPTLMSATGVRIVQANIPQGQKWDQEEEWRNFEKALKLTAATSDKSFEPAFVIWPETAVNADLSLFPEIGHILAASLPGDASAIVGNLRVTGSGNATQFFNSVTTLDKTNTVVDVYNKHHLVPFGEYIPFRKHIHIAPIAAAVSGIGDFTPGNGARTIRLKDQPAFSPLVCYEIIFPGTVADRKDRPDWLVNVTNDAWYGNSAGPYQHLAITRVRAIEEGLPVARAANTGISAMIDPVGRVIDHLPINEAGTIDSLLPKPLAPTLYTRLGEGFFFALAGLLLLPLLRPRKK